MTNSTSEREQRLKQIRERRNALQLRHGDWPCQTVHNSQERAFQQYILADIDFLLSLLDSEAAGKRDFEWALRELADGWITNNEREGPHGFNQNARRVLELIADDATTSMRDLCVSEILVMKAEHVARGDLPLGRKIFDEITNRLQSLTLEQEQK